MVDVTLDGWWNAAFRDPIAVPEERANECENVLCRKRNMF